MEAEEAAREKLIAKYPEEYSELYRVEYLKLGLELVRVWRVVSREVTEMEALTLCRHGWKIGEATGDFVVTSP